MAPAPATGGDRLGIWPRRAALRPESNACTTGAQPLVWTVYMRGSGRAANRLGAAPETPHIPMRPCHRRWIDDRVGKLPAKLLGELEAEGLFPLDAIGFAQRGDVDRAGVVGVQACGDAAVADVAVEQHEIRAERADLAPGWSAASSPARRRGP